jgi:hypothetical protein
MLVWTPGTGFDERLLQLAVDLDVSGPRIFDLQIALTAFEHGAAELWTHDRNFVKIPGLRLIVSVRPTTRRDRHGDCEWELRRASCRRALSSLSAG